MASQLICQEVIRSGITYQYVIVRNDEGKMKLYLNGYLCSSGICYLLRFLVNVRSDPTFVQDHHPTTTSILLILRDSGSSTQAMPAKIQQDTPKRFSFGIAHSATQRCVASVAVSYQQTERHASTQIRTSQHTCG